MDSIQIAREVLGWCTALNMGMLVLATSAIVFAGGWIRRIHGEWFHLADDDLSRAYFRYLAQYKIAIFVFNLAPYFALRIAS